MPAQAPDVRNKNFEEVTLGYTAEMAIDEAQRCLNCKNKPCMTGCPVQVKIPEFIAQVAEGKFLEAAAKINADLRTARSLRPCLPAGEPVRVPLRARHQGRAGRRSAVWSASLPTTQREHSTEKPP